MDAHTANEAPHELTLSAGAAPIFFARKDTRG
jgi:hypothetical protein